MASHRVDFGNPVVRLRENLVFIFGASRQAGHKDLPNTARAHDPHRVAYTVPVVEVADNSNRLSVRCPDRKARASAAA